jgi:DDE superfamily endonuclease
VADAGFVAAMADVLGVSERPVDSARPLVCFDEGGTALGARQGREPPPRPGHPAREDCEYVRAGSVNLLLWSAPHLGRRGVEITPQRTAIDWAQAIRHLVDDAFPAAARIVLVLANRNTHTPAALYRAFPPAEARRLLDKLEFHFTPKHASWLNVAEIELSALSRQCLARRLPDATTLATEVHAGVAARTAAQIGIDWHFTTADARIRLKRLYPEPVYAN